jgi:hypothetical protein
VFVIFLCSQSCGGRKTNHLSRLLLFDNKMWWTKKRGGNFCKFCYMTPRIKFALGFHQTATSLTAVVLSIYKDFIQFFSLLLTKICTKWFTCTKPLKYTRQESEGKKSRQKQAQNRQKIVACNHRTYVCFHCFFHFHFYLFSVCCRYFLLHFPSVWCNSLYTFCVWCSCSCMEGTWWFKLVYI